METQTVDKGGLTFKPEDYAADIAKLAAEQGLPAPVAGAQPAPTPTQEMPAQPAPTQAQATVTPTETKAQEPTPAHHVEVPEKFKTPDGALDTARLEKSTADADKALQTYLVKEKELKRKINEVRQAENAYLNPGNLPAPAPGNTALNPALTFEQQLEADAQSKGFGVVAARLFSAAQEAAVEQMRKELTPIKQGYEEAATTRQLEAIGKSDPWVYTPEGVGALTQILTDQPYLWQAPDPYKAAYMFSGRSVTARSSSQVLTPTPTAKASAPVPTAVAANMTPQAPTIRLDSRDAIDAHMKTLTTAQQEEFFVKMGLPRFNAR